MLFYDIDNKIVKVVQLICIEENEKFTKFRKRVHQRCNFESVQTPNSSDSINGYGEYDQYGFDVTFCCTPSLEGNYQNFNGRQAVFIVNGDTLIKQKPGVVEGIIGNMAAQSVNGDIGMGAMASAGVGSMSFG